MVDEYRPFAPPAEVEELKDTSGQLATNAIWIGYFIACPVCPIVAAVLIFVGGMMFSDPTDTGTPIGIIVLPLALATVGILLSYLFFLIFGIPLVLILRSRRKLTFVNLCWAGIISSVLLGTFFVGLAVRAGETPMNNSYWDVVTGMSIASLIYAVPLIVTISVFWIVASKADKRSASR